MKTLEEYFACGFIFLVATYIVLLVYCFHNIYRSK